MPTIETLILRRSYPVPVTFADLRRAFSDSFIDGDGGQLQTCRAEMERAIHRADRRPNAAKNARHVLASIHRDWVSAIKEATGATDDIYALIDGHEVRVGTVTGSGESATANIFGCISAGQAASILIAADEAGYWERPHEVRVVLQERPVSVAAVERAVNVGWTVKGGAA